MPRTACTAPRRRNDREGDRPMIRAPGMRATIVIACLALSPCAAQGQTYPSKPIRAIVPFAAGSFTDVLPRVVFEQAAANIKQPIIVENRGGAGGTIGTGAVAKAEP